MLELFGGFSYVLDKLIGRGAFGLSVLGETIRGMEPPEKGFWLLMWAIARFRGPEDLRAGLEENFVIEPELLEGIRSGALLARLRAKISGLAEILHPREFAAALRDPECMKLLQNRLDRFSETHAAELDAFFEMHLEYGYEVVELAGTATETGENQEERR